MGQQPPLGCIAISQLVANRDHCQSIGARRGAICSSWHYCSDQRNSKYLSLAHNRTWQIRIRNSRQLVASRSRCFLLNCRYEKRAKDSRQVCADVRKGNNNKRKELIETTFHTYFSAAGFQQACCRIMHLVRLRHPKQYAYAADHRTSA